MQVMLLRHRVSFCSTHSNTRTVTCWFWQAVTVVNSVSGKEKLCTPSAGRDWICDRSIRGSCRMMCTRGLYLCIDCRMICRKRRRGSFIFYKIKLSSIIIFYLIQKQTYRASTKVQHHQLILRLFFQLMNNLLMKYQTKVENVLKVMTSNCF